MTPALFAGALAHGPLDGIAVGGIGPGPEVACWPYMSLSWNQGCSRSWSWSWSGSWSWSWSLSWSWSWDQSW